LTDIGFGLAVIGFLQELVKFFKDDIGWIDKLYQSTSDVNIKQLSFAGKRKYTCLE
jgi:hypothetical protein